MSNIPHTVRTSLFGYFGKASVNEKLPDPQGSLARDCTVQETATIFKIFPKILGRAICENCAPQKFGAIQYLVATTRNSYNIPTNDAGTSIYSENYAQHRPLKW